MSGTGKIKRTAKPGFTLIELIASIGIFVLLLSLVFSIGSFGNNTFSKSDSKATLQSNLRNASMFITKELRYASNIVILDKMPSAPDPAVKYIFIDSQGTLKQCIGGNVSDLLDGTLKKIKCSLEFDDKDSQTLNFKLQGTLGKLSYSLDSSVVLLNIGTSSLAGQLPGPVISYTAGVPYMSNKNVNPVTKIEITAASNILLNNGGTLQLSASVEPTNAFNKSLVWTVDNPALATIDAATGLLRSTGASLGVVSVTASAKDGSGVVSKPFVVTIQSPAASAPAYVAGSFKDKLLFKTNQQSQVYTVSNLKSYFSYTGADLTYTVTSTNYSVASMTVSGGNLTITPSAPGNATITVTARNSLGQAAEGTFSIQVVKIFISTPTYSPFYVGKGTKCTVGVTVQPAGLSYSILWKASGGAIAPVPGTATATFSAPNGNKKTSSIYAVITVGSNTYNTDEISIITQ